MTDYEYLRNADAEAEEADLRKAFSRDAGAVLTQCERCVAEAERAVRDVEILQTAREEDCRNALQNVRAAGETLIAGLPVTRSFFSQALTREELERLCYAVTRLEHAHHALQATLAALGAVGECWSACRIRILRAERTVYTVKQIAGEPLAPAAETLRALEVRSADAVARLLRRREMLGRFSADTLVRFCDGVRRLADLPNGGEGSRASAIRQLGADLLLAIDRIL